MLCKSEKSTPIIATLIVFEVLSRSIGVGNPRYPVPTGSEFGLSNFDNLQDADGANWLAGVAFTHCAVVDETKSAVKISPVIDRFLTPQFYDT